MTEIERFGEEEQRGVRRRTKVCEEREQKWEERRAGDEQNKMSEE